jgi:hypothetical protein
MNRTRILAILVFDDVEVLDLCGPFEVFRQVGPALRRYVESLSGYKKDTLPELLPDLRE